MTSAIGPLAPLLQAEFSISRAEIGLVQTAIYLSATWAALVGLIATLCVRERRRLS